jgi:hypothetical protein
VIVAVSIAAWFSISNHCAVGALIDAQKQSATMQMHCHGNPSPPSKSGGEEMPCCKILRATVTSQAKIVKIGINDLLPIQSWIAAKINFVHEMYFHRSALELDTGPPFVASFAESVLQRSILAHAPPYLA